MSDIRVCRVCATSLQRDGVVYVDVVVKRAHDCWCWLLIKREQLNHGKLSLNFPKLPAIYVGLLYPIPRRAICPHTRDLLSCITYGSYGMPAVLLTNGIGMQFPVMIRFLLLESLTFNFSKLLGEGLLMNSALAV